MGFYNLVLTLKWEQQTEGDIADAIRIARLNLL